MARQSGKLSHSNDKFDLDAHILSGDFMGYSPSAQVNLADSSVDYAKHFTLANTITSVTHSMTF